MLTLVTVPGLEAVEGAGIKIRALAHGDRSEVLKDLTEWAKKDRSNFSKIIKAMMIVSQTKRGHKINENHFKSCAAYEGVYEFRAHQGEVRVMCFYHADVIVCTNTFRKVKTKSSQTDAFKKCADWKSLWDKLQAQQNHEQRRLK